MPQQTILVALDKQIAGLVAIRARLVALKEGAPIADTAKPPRGATIETWMRALGDADPIPDTDSIFAYAEKAGIPVEYLELAWLRFCEAMRERKIRKLDWRAHFRNAVRGNWYHIWWMSPDGECKLTTVGEQARRVA